MKKIISLIFIMFLLPGAVIAGGTWGALAYDKNTGRSGYSWNQYGRHSAIRAAMRRCGHDCRILTTFSRSCVALATDRRGVYGWARDHNSYSARRRARNACRRYGGHHCRVKVSVCSGVSVNRRHYY